MNDLLKIGGKTFNSRLMTGTGKHGSPEDLVASVEASGTEIITVAIRRLNLDDPNEKAILDYLDWDCYQILPNTAGSTTADEAGRMAYETGRIPVKAYATASSPLEGVPEAATAD